MIRLHKVFRSVWVFALFIWGVFLTDGVAEDTYRFFKVGSIPKEAIFEMRDHNRSLYYWMNAYLEGMIPGGLTVIHVDTHADDYCSCINSHEKARVFLNKLKAVPLQERKKYFESVFNADGVHLGIQSFIIPAMYMGIIQRFIWVRPNYHHFREEKIWRKEAFFYYLLEAKQLEAGGYCYGSSDNCRFDDGFGIDNFEIRELPYISGPVLLDIDMDAFGDNDTSRLCKLKFSLGEIESLVEELIVMLKRRAPEVYMVTISDSPGVFSTEAALSKKPYLKARLSGGD